MIISTISHEEATIRSFMRDPEFAERLLKEVIADGDCDEIRRVKRRIDEARARLREHEMELKAGEAERAMPELNRWPSSVHDYDMAAVAQG